jgi:hypothetical protein
MRERNIKMDNQQVSIQQRVRAEGLNSSNLPDIQKYRIDFVQFINSLHLNLKEQALALGLERHTMKRIRNKLFKLYEAFGLPKGFRTIPLDNCSKYAVDRVGNIINVKTRELMSTTTDRKGYVRANISYVASNGTKVKYIRTHRAVALTFLSRQHDKQLEVNHISGNKLDNSVQNLEWCTMKENMAHKTRTGLTSSLKGEDNPASKMTESKVQEARIRHKKGESAYSLAREFNLDVSTMCDIVNYTTWTHVE